MKIFFYKLKDRIALILCFLLFMLLVNAGAFAQNLTIKGKVIDSDGNTLPGTAVLVKGTTNGSTTNDDGDYTLSNVPNGAIISFQLVGFVPQEVKVTAEKTTIVTILIEEPESLDDVTVVAFGKQKKSSVVASVETVKVSDLRIPASNLTSALAGRVAGIISYQTTGEPGADNANFFVRGVTTFGYKKDPLILIDGFESTTDDLARLQTDDIESFSVMKDAAATVMYGARSANGIISVVTKSGREGQAKIDVRLDMNIATPTRSIEFLDGVSYMRLFNEARLTRDPLLGTFYDEQKIQATERGEYPMIYPNVDWYGALFNKATVNEKGYVSVSGGGQVATYHVSGGLDHETGLLKVDKRNNFNNNIDINRIQLRSNVVFKLTSSTTLDTRISGRFERYTGPYVSASDIFHNVMWSNPVDFPFVYEPDEEHMFTEHILFGSTIVGQGTGSDFWKVNPYANMVKGYEDRNESSINMMATFTQKLDFITKGLNLQLKGSISSWSKYRSRRTYSPFFYALETFDQITGDYKLFALNPNTGNQYLGNVEPERDASAQYYYEAILNWNRAFGDHTIAGTLVGIAQENLITGGNSLTIYETLPEKNLGISGRFSYNYKERYFIEPSFGYNGSEKFTGDKRFGFFPAVGAGWILSNESFFEPVKDVVSMLKLKASWGKGGNDAISGRDGRFFFLSDISYGGSTYRWGQDFLNAYDGYVVSRYANPDITWEVSNKYNYGFEIGLFKDEAFKLQLEYFIENRDKIYMTRENFPKSAGLEAAISGNVGKLEAHGIDGSIDYQHFFSKDFWMQGRANFTYAANKLTELDEKDYPDEYLKRKGHSWDQQWGLIAERLFVDQNEINNSPKQDWTGYMAGDIKYKDVNGDGMVNDNDKVPMGYPTTPEIQYGFGLSLGYKNFDVSFFFQGNARVSFFIDPGVDDDEEGIAPFVNQRNALPIIARDYWSETNPNPHAFWPRLSTTPVDNNMQQSSWWLRDASFVRLKNLEIGYSFPGLSKIGLKTSRVYFSSENLFVLSSFKLWDPEMGRKGLGYPPNKRFNIGLQLSF
jgi:TonB-linked SusC/RagA family outer membrane protein